TWRLLLRTPPSLADFTHARPCKPICEKSLTPPQKSFMRNVFCQIMFFHHFLGNVIHKASIGLIDICELVLLFLGIQHGNIKSEHFFLLVCYSAPLCLPSPDCRYQVM